MFGFRTVGSGLSNMQRSKAQEGRYGKDGGGLLKKTFDFFFRRVRSSCLEIKHSITAPSISSVTNVFPQRAMMFRLHAGK